MFPSCLEHSLAGEALRQKKWEYNTINLRDFGIGKHSQVDDTPYGGGAGMVIRADVLGTAIESIDLPKTKLIYMSPRGKPLNQEKVKELSDLSDISIICGRFEGIDERILEYYDIEEVSVGDYVLSGGEPAALILMDAIIRLLPDVIGNSQTHAEESFTNNLLEYPHYTRPAQWNGLEVPEILKSGNHKKIEEWRKEKSIELTQLKRPDLC